MVLILKYCVLLTLLLGLVCGDDKEDKYDMFVDKLEMVKGNDILAAADIKIKKTGPTSFVLDEHIEHFKEFNDNWTLAIQVSKSDTADGPQRPFLTYDGSKGICSIMKNEYKKYFYNSIKDCSNAPHFDLCPLKEAKYTFNKCSFDASVFKKFLSKGYYFIKLLMSHSDEKDIVEYDLYVHVEDKK